MSLVLLVEDEEKIREKIASNLVKEGHAVETISEGAQFSFEKVSSLQPSIMVLDRLLGNMDSLEKVPEIKARLPELYILVLSAIDSPIEKARALELGADDYLSKPFVMTELMARVKALQRRQQTRRPGYIDIGQARLDLDSRTLTFRNHREHLPNKEFGVLRLLASEPGQVFSKQQFLEQVWEAAVDIDSNAVETTITSLRRRLADIGSGITVKNMRNAGYRLEVQNL